MEQQNGGPEKKASETAFNTQEIERIWESLGQGGRVVFSLCMLFLVYSFFLNGNQFIELSEVDVRGDQYDKLVGYLEEENIEYRYTEDGVLRIPSDRAIQVSSFLDSFVRVEDPSNNEVSAQANLPDLTNFRLPSYNRSVQRLEKKIKATEGEIERYEGIESASIVPNRLATERQSFDRAPKFNRVTVQIELEDDKRSIGLGSDMINLIKSHVSAALDVPVANVQMFDLNGRNYEVTANQFTAADVRQKVSVVESKVSEFMANIFPRDSFRIQVNVGLPSEASDKLLNEEIWPGVKKINEKLIQLTPVTAPLPQDVVTLTALKNAQSRSRYGSFGNSDLNNVAVTVFIDREPAQAVLDQADYEQRLNFDPVISIPSQESFQSITRDIATHLEEHLRTTFPGDIVSARLVPVNLIGANGQLADSSWAIKEFVIPTSSAGGSSQNTTIFFLATMAFLFVVLMFRDGPRDAENRYSIKGFHGGFVERSVADFNSRTTFGTGITPGDDPVIVQQIIQKSFEERIDILRSIAANGEDNLPGSNILALMIFDLSENRQEIFSALSEEECSVLFELVNGIVAPIGNEEIEDAFAAFELINVGLNNGTEIPVLVTTVPTRPQIDHAVMDEIRSNNSDLADVISKNRKGSTPEKSS